MAEIGTDSPGPEPGKVNAVRRQWMVHEDGAVAHDMQEDEFAYKYGLNRFNRRTVREDIPVAKVVQTEEEERLQIERMEQLKELQRREKDDSIVAQQIMNQAMLEEERNRVATEMRDQRIAQELQEKEKERFERKQQERQLAKERQKLERMLHEQASDVGLPGNENSVNSALEALRVDDTQDKLLRVDGRIEDVGDFSDFYLQPSQTMGEGQQKELQEMQDEELARLLQDQEHKRGGQINRDKLKAIEAQDGELAKIIQEQEKLKSKKKKRGSNAGANMGAPAAIRAGAAPHQQRALAERQMSQPPPFRQPPDYHDRQERHSFHVGSDPNGPMYINATDDVIQMRTARDTPPPLPPGHPVMELNHSKNNQDVRNNRSSRDQPNSPGYEPPVDYGSRSPTNQSQHQNAFAMIDPTFDHQAQRPVNRYEMGMLQRSADNDPSIINHQNNGVTQHPGGPPINPQQQQQYSEQQQQQQPSSPVNLTSSNINHINTTTVQQSQPQLPSSNRSRKDKKGSCKQQ